MRAKQGLYNVIFGLTNQVITIALGIVVPRLFLLSFGSEVNGLISSINQIFVYLTILEAGVGGASLQALYSPLAKKDKNGINAVLAATSKYYKKTGAYYFFAVLIFAIVYPFVISSNLSKLTVAGIIILIGMAGVINFFFQGKFKILLEAEGKGYITTNVTTIINVLTSVAKIILLLLGANIILIQVSYFLIQVLQMSIIWIYIKKNYKWINLSVKPNFKSISQKSSVLVHQISGMVFSNTDVLVLTVFCGLKVVSVYVMYNMLFDMINVAVTNINRGVVFVLGQTFYEDKKKYIRLYDSYELYYVAIVFSLYAIAYTLILPFMKLYTSGINDINYIDFWIPTLFVILKLLVCARTPGINTINVSGHFKQTQYRAIIESTINIVLSLIFVKFFGMYGVLIGTIGALLYRTNDIIIYSNKKILNRSALITYKRWIINIIAFLVITFVINMIHLNSSSYIHIIINAIILAIIVIPVFIVIVSLFEMKVCRHTLSYIRPYTDKIRNKIKK